MNGVLMLWVGCIIIFKIMIVISYDYFKLFVHILYVCNGSCLNDKVGQNYVFHVLNVAVIGHMIWVLI